MSYYVFSAPVESIKIEQIINCKIPGSQSHSCSDYMQTILPGHPSCVVDLIWEYQISNEGTACGEINSVQATQDNEVLPAISLTEEQKDLCPDETLVIEQLVFGVNLCNYFGKSIVFQVEVNGGGDNLNGEGVALFPAENTSVSPSFVSIPTTTPVIPPVAAPTSV